MSEFFLENKKIVHIKMGQADPHITQNRDAMSVVNRLADRIDAATDVKKLQQEARAIHAIVLEAEKHPQLKHTVDATRRMLLEEGLLTPSGELVDVADETLENLKQQLNATMEAWPARLREGEWYRWYMGAKGRVVFLANEAETNWEAEFLAMESLCKKLEPTVIKTDNEQWWKDLVTILYRIKALRM